MIIRVSICIIVFLFFVLQPATAQSTNSYQQDTATVMRLIKTAQRYRFFKPDSSLPPAQEALYLSKSINFKQGKILAYQTLAEYHRVSGNYPESLDNLFKALPISEEIRDLKLIAEVQGFIGITYLNLKEYRTALHYMFRSYAQKERLQVSMTSFLLCNAGIAYQEMNMLDSALIFQKMAWAVAQTSQVPPGKAFVLRETGNVYNLLNLPDSAFYYYRFALAVTNDVLNIGRTYSRLAILHYKLGRSDSALYYANKALSFGRRSSQKPIILEASKTLATYYITKNKLDSALKYQQLTMSINDSLFGSEQLRKLQLLAIEEQKKVFLTEQKQQENEQKQKDYQSNLRFYGLISLLAVFLLFGIFLYRSNEKQKNTNVLLQQQKQETEKTLTDLQATQVQLIQSEKMASLGELTAGIAHEIQNPLNFVNNFSEVNRELLAEMEQEMERQNYGDVRALTKNIVENEEKISHHGKRAETIVKAMLQHSRTSTGVKEPTDINKLADEYLRLAYQGIRTKDKLFTAEVNTNFDDSIGNISIMSQDIGRVILNLINNAFYAVTEKKKQAGVAYEPAVLVSTKKLKDSIEISVKDNGTGIPKNVIDKIFQPFFTTKPTGQGTGLGLSLAYDIVKAHGGELKVETKEGEGAEFILRIPSR